jgi:putative hemolysin
MTKKYFFWFIFVILIILGGVWTTRLSAPTTNVVVNNSSIGLANPASTYCVEQGGDLKIETRPDGGEFGVCYFMDNYQCEEWAMMRGECPVGGRKVTGYITPAGRFCAISGGEYAITVEDGVETEKGDCKLPSGEVCGADEFWEGSCPFISIP